MDALEFDLTRCDSSEDGVSSKQVEVRSYMVQGRLPATQLDSGAQLPSRGPEFQSFREDTTLCERRGGIRNRGGHVGHGQFVEQ